MINRYFDHLPSSYDVGRTGSACIAYTLLDPCILKIKCEDKIDYYWYYTLIVKSKHVQKFHDMLAEGKLPLFKSFVLVRRVRDQSVNTDLSDDEDLDDKGIVVD
jgi:hypothetical protein